LCSYNLQQCDAAPPPPLGEITALPSTQTSRLDFGERKRRGEGSGKGKKVVRKRARGKLGKGKSERGKEGE